MLRFHEFFNQDSCFFNFYCFFVKTICEKSKFIFVLESWKHTSYLIQRSWLWNRKLQYLGTKLVTLYFLLRIFVNFDVHCDFESNFRILKICDLFTSEILRLACDLRTTETFWAVIELMINKFHGVIALWWLSVSL